MMNPNPPGTHCAKGRRRSSPGNGPNLDAFGLVQKEREKETGQWKERKSTKGGNCDARRTAHDRHGSSFPFTLPLLVYY
jgi:hypothetical protein